MELILLRHTKSSWSEPGGSDHERSLNDRGQKAATLLGDHFKRNGIRPKSIICSTAKRTRATLAPILSCLGMEEADVHFTDEIYEAPASAYRDVISAMSDGHDVLVVGHNPTTEELALSLLHEDAPRLLAHIATGYPTGGLTRILFEDGPWNQALAAGGQFGSFVSPRVLPI